MKSVSRGPLGREEAGVKVGDDDLGQMTSKSGEKTFLSQDEILHVQSRGCHMPNAILVFHSCPVNFIFVFLSKSTLFFNFRFRWIRYVPNSGGLTISWFISFHFISFISRAKHRWNTLTQDISRQKCCPNCCENKLTLVQENTPGKTLG